MKSLALASHQIATAQDVARVRCRRFRTRIPFTFLGGGRGGGRRDGYPWPFPPSSSALPRSNRASERERQSVLASAAQPIHRFLRCSFHVVIVTVRDSFKGWKGGERGAIEFLYRTVLLHLSCSCRWQNPTPIGIGLLSLPLMRLRWEEGRRKALELGSFILPSLRRKGGVRHTRIPLPLLPCTPSASPSIRRFSVFARSAEQPQWERKKRAEAEARSMSSPPRMMTMGERFGRKGRSLSALPIG